jgi:hypothetical protein
MHGGQNPAVHFIPPNAAQQQLLRMDTNGTVRIADLSAPPSSPLGSQSL